MDHKFITKARLKSERGWTDKLIQEFLGTPDSVKPNPHFKSAPPMLLFLLDRVDKIEQTDEFKTQKVGTNKRKKAAQKAVETKRQQLWEWLNTVEIEIPIINREELIRQACRHYNDRRLDKDVGGLAATPQSDPKFLERISVNYLRHCLTKYEEHLDNMSGKVGFDDGYKEIRRKIFCKIAEKYEWLEEECKRQTCI